MSIIIAIVMILSTSIWLIYRLMRRKDPKESFRTWTKRLFDAFWGIG